MCVCVWYGSVCVDGKNGAGDAIHSNDGEWFLGWRGRQYSAESYTYNQSTSNSKSATPQQYVMWYYGVLCMCVSSVRYWRWLLNAGVCVWLGPHVAIQAAKSSLMNMFPLDVWTVVWTQWGPANILPIHHIYSVDEIIDIWTLCALRSTHCSHVCVWHQSTDKRNAGDERQKEAE